MNVQHMFRFTLALELATHGIASAVQVAPDSSETPVRPPPIRVVYFVPSNVEPLSNRVERLDRTLEEVRRFYRDGMAAAGYGPMTFELEGTPPVALCCTRYAADIRWRRTAATMPPRSDAKSRPRWRHAVSMPTVSCF